MSAQFEKYRSLPIDGALLSLEWRDRLSEPYFCYSINALPIGFEGCILYCFIDGYGDMVFASNPESYYLRHRRHPPRQRQEQCGDYRDRLILNPRLHLTEEGKARAMERIQEIQLAAQGSQKNRFLLERGLRLYEQTSGRLRDMAGQLVGYWKWLMNQGSLIEQQRNYEKVKEQMDYLETVAEADPLAENFWFDEPEESFEDLGDEGEE